MTVDDIQVIAIEAGIQPPVVYHGDAESDTPWIARTSELVRFAELLREVIGRESQRNK